MSRVVHHSNRKELEANALLHLNALLSKLIETNPFYQKKIAASGLQNPLRSLDDFYQTFPFTTKAELEADQIEHPPFGTNLTFPLEKYTRFSQTSGSTGKPMRWLDTEESWDWMIDNWVRVFEAANVKAGESIFFAFSFGPFLGFWVAFDAAKKIGCLCIPGGGMSTIARLYFLVQNKVDILCCTPTYALHLASVAQNEKIDLSEAGIRAIIVAGEPGASIPATRARLLELWPGAQIYDHHGMTEIGPVSYQCPKQPGILHILEPEFIAEVVDSETNQPVKPGETGELILTNLGRIASPLLRYRTGDIVKPLASNPCACGSYELALEGGIIGRSDDMVQIRGVNVYPTAIEQIVREFPEVAEYRVEISQAQEMNEMAIQVEVADGVVNFSELASQIEKAFRLNFSLRIPVKIVSAGTLPRFEMKAKRWVKV